VGHDPPKIISECRFQIADLKTGQQNLKSKISLNLKSAI
jgi:hypothetical protein